MATSIASSGHTQNDFLSTINWLLKVNFHWQWIWDWMTHLCSTSHLHASRVRSLLRASSRWASGTGLVAGLQYRTWGDISSLSCKMPFSYSGAAQKGKMLETRFCLSFSLTAISSRHVDACSACCLTIRIIKNPITPVLFLLLWEKKKIIKKHISFTVHPKEEHWLVLGIYAWSCGQTLAKHTLISGCCRTESPAQAGTGVGATKSKHRFKHRKKSQI